MRRIALFAAVALLAPAGAGPGRAVPVSPGAWVPTYASGLDGDVSMFPDGTAYAWTTGFGGVIATVSKDFGATWTQVAPPPGSAKFPRFGTPKIGYAQFMNVCEGSSCHREVYRTTDGGLTWLRATSVPGPGPAWYQMNLWAHGVAPGGRTVVVPAWRQRRGPGCPPGYQPWPKAESEVFVSRDGARTWEHHKLPVRAIAHQVVMLDDRYGAMAVTEYHPSDPLGCERTNMRGAVWLTTDGGRRWRRSAATCPDGACLSVALPSRDRIVVGQTRGTVEVSHDGGRSFRAVLLEPGDTCWPLGGFAGFSCPMVWDVVFPEPQVGYAITGNGRIWRTADGGLTWLLDGTSGSSGFGWYRLGVADTVHAVAVTPVGLLTRISPAGARRTG